MLLPLEPESKWNLHLYATYLSSLHKKIHYSVYAFYIMHLNQEPPAYTEQIKQCSWIDHGEKKKSFLQSLNTSIMNIQLLLS